MKRHLVDKYVYAALPFGVIDKTRMPLAKHLGGAGPISGQVRICCHPQLFMRANLVRREGELLLWQLLAKTRLIVRRNN